MIASAPSTARKAMTWTLRLSSITTLPRHTRSKLTPGHDLAGALEEHGEQVMAAPAKLPRLADSQQFVPRSTQDESAEAVLAVVHSADAARAVAGVQ